MAIAELEQTKRLHVEAYDKEAAKQILINEAKLGLFLAEKGINYNPDEIRPFQDDYEQSSAYNRQRGLTGISLPRGVTARGGFNRFTPYSLVVEDRKPVLYDDGTRIGEISFHKAHPVTRELLSDGEKFRHVANVSQEGGISVAYSKE